MRRRWSHVPFLLSSLLVFAISAPGAIVASETRTAGGFDFGEEPDPCPTPPGEVTGVLMGDPDASTLSWDPDPCATDFNVYRGRLSDLAQGLPAKCHADEIQAASLATPDAAETGDGYFFLVTAEANREATPGSGSDGETRSLLGGCNAVVRQHVLTRVGYGWDEWTRDRIQTLGIRGYLDEQLDPALIDESTNTELNDALLNLEPPETIQELQGFDLVRAVYGRRQLEQAVTVFWANHFNTDYNKSFPFFNVYDPDTARKRLEATKLHYDEQEIFRSLAFNGNFREILEASAYSSAMIIYLDTKNNVSGNPNENYAREILELHSLGVNGGYTAFDIVELARVFTGWNVCKKETPGVGDPLAACIASELIGTPEEPEGLWVANFRVDRHDCQQKVLFAGTPQETVIPDTCATPADGVNDTELALDAIALHPSTAQFVSTKLLEAFVTESPTNEMIGHVVAVWDGVSVDPAGTGVLIDVLTAVLAEAAFLDPDEFRNKIKTPFEHMASAFRAVRGNTNGTSQVRSFLKRMGHLLHENPVPTGYAEVGGAWLDTNNTLERQNFGADMSDGTGTNFGADVTGLLQDHGVSTAPGNAAGIVDFLSDVMFGGAISPAERQAAIEFLETGDDGLPDPSYNNLRIRQTAGYLLGFAQFQEQ